MLLLLIVQIFAAPTHTYTHTHEPQFRTTNTLFLFKWCFIMIITNYYYYYLIYLFDLFSFFLSQTHFVVCWLFFFCFALPHTKCSICLMFSHVCLRHHFHALFIMPPSAAVLRFDRSDRQWWYMHEIFFRISDAKSR